MLECVINVSEGRDLDRVAMFARSVGPDLLDVHTDPDHHRSVLTLVGTSAPRVLSRTVLEHLSIDAHSGVHPRLGVIDVVPFVPLAGSTMEDAIAARDGFAGWIADELGVPAFLYGPERSLPHVRKHAFSTLTPDFGPRGPHQRGGAVCVGARPPLVAWNVWLSGVDIERTRRLAAMVRSDTVRTLGLQVGEHTQVSCNLIAPEVTGPAAVADQLARHVDIERCELVGLVPASVLGATPRTRWRELDLDPQRTIEWRLERRREKLESIDPEGGTGEAGVSR